MHGDTYDYSAVTYKTATDKVTIICRTHGPFEQLLPAHIRGQGCPRCASLKYGSYLKKDKTDFIKKAQEKWGEKFDYEDVQYLNNKTPVLIKCIEHNCQFRQAPNNHYRTNGCSQCQEAEKAPSKSGGANPKYDTKTLIEVLEQIFPGKYTYEKTEYVNMNTKIIVTCPTHGDFYKRPADMKGKKKGCQKCHSMEIRSKQLSDPEIIIGKIKNIHGEGAFDFSKFAYDGLYVKAVLICQKCKGEFEIRPNDVIQGQGCKKCSMERRSEANRITQEEIIARCKSEHGDRYDYSRVECNPEEGVVGKITIICKKHGEFRQRANCHYSGYNCPKCKSSKREHNMRKLLTLRKIDFEEQKVFVQSVDKRFIYDFFLPGSSENPLQLLIEMDGEQHFHPVEMFGGEEGFKRTKARDLEKVQWALDNGYKLARIHSHSKERLKPILERLLQKVRQSEAKIFVDKPGVYAEVLEGYEVEKI